MCFMTAILQLSRRVL